MDAIYQELADRVVGLCKTKSARSSLQLPTTQRRVLIGLAGPPGSGKSTVAVEVARRIEQAHSRLKVAVVSLDGFHLTLAVLNARPDAKVALARRGAPWTFDGVAAVQLVQRLKETFGAQSVIVPTFDHAAKDPVPKGLVVEKDTQVCIIEGNYVLSDEGAWSAIADMVDDRWLLQVDPTLARKRVATRHLQSGIEPTMELALARTDYNDMPNGRYVMERSVGRYDRLVTSLEEHG
ncbi:hypothetical protein ANO14919_049880 [Xylariales sp. No.14919]|nr:hypothetical protein ANO14919_049880 [Xylariales sp. No.14919]